MADSKESITTSKLNFSKSEAIKFGWEIAKKHIWFFVVIFVIMALVSMAPNSINNYTKNNFPLLAFVLTIIIWAVQMIIQMGLINVSLKFVDGKKPEYSDLFYYTPIVNYIAGSILYGLIVFLGFILLIIPGIYFAIKYQFYAYLIIDKGFGPVAALKKSAEMTKGIKWSLFLFGLLIAGINILGVLALLVGLLWTFPTTIIATAFVYRKLLVQVK